MENEDAMLGMSEVLAIIPARIGSTGIPRKNFRELAGLSPLARAVECCNRAGINRPVVSTDNTAFPYLQGPYSYLDHYACAPLHTDTCSMVDVVLDVLKTYPGPGNQKILLVQPTQPLREPKHLEQAIALLDRNASVASVVEVEPAAKLYYAGFWCVEGEDVERRQSATPTYACDGTVYGFRRGWFMRNRAFRTTSTYMLTVSPSETARLDTPFDWEMAELRLRSRESKMSCRVYADNECVRSAGSQIREIRRNVLRALALDPQVADSFEGPSDHEFADRMPPPCDEDR